MNDSQIYLDNSYLYIYYSKQYLNLHIYGRKTKRIPSYTVYYMNLNGKRFPSLFTSYISIYSLSIPFPIYFIYYEVLLLSYLSRYSNKGWQFQLTIVSNN